MSDPVRATVHDPELPVDEPDDFQIVVEFPEEPPAAPVTRGGVEPTPRGVREQAAQIEERSKYAVGAAMNTIREMALQTDLMRKAIPEGSQPRMIKVKFGVKLDFEVGAILAKSSAGATMEVELEWAGRGDDVLRVLRAETDVESALFTPSDAPTTNDEARESA